MKWKHFPRYWQFVPGEFAAKRPVTQSFECSLICVWINSWVNNREAGDLRRYRAHYDVTVLRLLRYVNEHYISLMFCFKIKRFPQNKTAWITVIITKIGLGKQDDKQWVFWNQGIIWRLLLSKCMVIIWDNDTKLKVALIRNFVITSFHYNEPHKPVISRVTLQEILYINNKF